MPSKATVRDMARRAYWRERDARVVVDAWRRSGETVAQFARAHGLDPRRVGRWGRRLERATAHAGRFHPVRVVDRRVDREGPDARGAVIEITRADGWRVRVPPGFAAEELRRILAVLTEAAAC